MSNIIDNPWFSAVRNPRWVNAEHSLIECEVNFLHVGFEEWTPFCANPEDHLIYSKIIFDRCASGEYGPVAEYVDITGSTDAPIEYGSDAWREIQALRDNQIPKVVL